MRSDMQHEIYLYSSSDSPKQRKTTTTQANDVVNYWQPKCKFLTTVLSSNIELTLP